MSFIIINWGWDGVTQDIERAEDINILSIKHDVIDAEAIVIVRDWIFNIYDGVEMDEVKHWHNRRQLANTVVEAAIKNNLVFWKYVKSDSLSSLSVKEVLYYAPTTPWQEVEAYVVENFRPQ